MKRIHLVAAVIGLAATTIVVTATPLKGSVKKLITYVTLQPTPGTAETGYVNINGVMFVSNSSTSGCGLNATVSGTGSTGIFVTNSKATGAGFGMTVLESSPDGQGIRVSAAGSGIESNSTKAGIIATSVTEDGIYSGTNGSYRSGVYGYTSTANSNGGWFGSYATTGTGVGVGGVQGSSNGWGVYSIGRSGGSGPKLFQIDDPKDPENSLLNHYSSEGPEPYNVYSGNTVTDVKGYATVQLPDYFEEINKDFRYQLTVVDGKDSNGFVMAKVSREIADNQFTIRSSQPRIKISWRVEAVRNDRWARKYGTPAREAKSEAMRGKYVEPDLYNKPTSRGMYPRSSESTTRPR